MAVVCQFEKNIPQGLNRLRKNSTKGLCNKGTALQAAEKLDVVKGHEFTRAANRTKSARPLGPEGSFSGDSPSDPHFSAACLAGPIKSAEYVGLHRLRKKSL
jgi:hypothetical protein